MQWITNSKYPVTIKPATFKSRCRCPIRTICLDSGLKIINWRWLFKQLDKSLANGYALYTADQNGNWFTGLYLRGWTICYQWENHSRWESPANTGSRLWIHPLKSDLTAGFDNFYDYGNYLKRNDKPEDAFNAYNNALRYMGRPAKMVQLVSLSLADIGKTMISRNVDMIKGLNALKTAYNLTPPWTRNTETTLLRDLTNLFWRLAGQENYTAIVDEAGKWSTRRFKALPDEKCWFYSQYHRAFAKY